MKRVEANDPASISCYLLYITMEHMGCSRIVLRQWNYLLGQQSLVIVMHIVNLLTFITKGGIGRRHGNIEFESGNREGAVKNYTIAASAGHSQCHGSVAKAI